MGSGCPARLRLRDSPGGGELDLVVIAPDAHETRNAGWLDNTVSGTAARLARDGLLCALAAPGHRSRLVRLLRACGLDPTCAFLYHGTATGEDDLLPLQRGAIQHVASTWPAAHTRVGRLKARLLSGPGSSAMLRRWHRGTMIVARHPGARHLFEWLLQSTSDNGSASTAVIHAKWRRNRASVVLRALSPGGQLAAVAKLTLGESQAGCRISQEADFLEYAGENLRHVDISVPKGRVLTREAAVPVLLENVVPGDSAASLLLAGRISSSKTLATLGEKLLAWGRKTCVTRTIDSAWIEREILRPAAEIIPLLTGAGEYLAWLQARCHALTGARVPLTTTHGDLTMWNVLVTPAGSWGFVDWEGGKAEGLPLGDLCYGALDIAAAAHQYKNRVGAFIECFEGGGPTAHQVARLRTELGQALGLSRGAALLWFHACWLQHAAEESGKRSEMEPHPFRGIVGRLASQPTSYETVGLTE